MKIFRIIPIPGKLDNGYLSIIPEHEYLLINQASFSPIDKDELD